MLTVVLLSATMMFAQSNTTGAAAQRDSTLQSRATEAEPDYTFGPGDTIIIAKSQVRYLTGEKMDSWVYYVCHVIRSVGGKRFPEGALIDGIMSWTDVNGLLLVAPSAATQDAMARQRADAERIRLLMAELEGMDEATRARIRRSAEAFHAKMLTDADIVVDTMPAFLAKQREKFVRDSLASEEAYRIVLERGIVDSNEAHDIADSIAAARGAKVEMSYTKADEAVTINIARMMTNQKAQAELDAILKERNIMDEAEARRLADNIQAAYGADLEPLYAVADRVVKLNVANDKAAKELRERIIAECITDPEQARALADNLAAKYGATPAYLRGIAEATVAEILLNWRDKVHRLTLGVRGGVASWMQKAGESQWKVGGDGLFDLQYAFYKVTKSKNNVGFLVGASVGYVNSGMGLNGINDIYTTPTSDGDIRYTISANGIKEKDGAIVVEVPLMFSVVSEKGVFFNIGPRFQMPVWNHYALHFENPNIKAFFPEEGVEIDNRLITGLINDKAIESKGKFTSSSFNLLLGAEFGYEWQFKNNNSLGLGIYADYGVYSMYKNNSEAHSIIDITAPSSTIQPAQIRYQSAQDVYGTGIGFFDCGLKLAYHFNFIKYKQPSNVESK